MNITLRKQTSIKNGKIHSLSMDIQDSKSFISDDVQNEFLQRLINRCYYKYLRGKIKISEIQTEDEAFAALSKHFSVLTHSKSNVIRLRIEYHKESVPLSVEEMIKFVKEVAENVTERLH